MNRVSPSLLEADLKEERPGQPAVMLPAATLLVHWRDQVILRRGLLSDADAPFTPGPICRRAMDRETTISLVNTTLFPGRHEFDPVLKNLPAVLIVPLGTHGIVVLGGWSERCFSQADEQWLKAGLHGSERNSSATTKARYEVDQA